MPSPLELCLEDLGSKDDGKRFLQCVALAGNEPGLGLDPTGRVVWRGAGLACDLWISADEQLMLRRLEDAPAIEVTRAGRGLEAPVGKPVILLNRDEIRVGQARLRLHVHGPASAVHPPASVASAGSSRTPLANPPPIAFRPMPPAPMPPPRPEPPKPPPPKPDPKKG